MHCRNCGNEVVDQAVMCVSCGLPPTAGKNYCQACKTPTDPAAEVCRGCGRRLAGAAGEAVNSKLIAALLGIFVGSLGIHRFYLGYTNIGVVQLLLGLGGMITCGVTTLASAVWGLVEGILILTGSIDRDAQGRPLKD
jgi:TM2 domain-containing membrane protein YozV